MSEDKFQVYFEYMNVNSVIRPASEGFNLELNPKLTIGELKKIIEDHDGLPADAQRLIFTGRNAELNENDKTVDEYKLHQDSRVFILIQRNWQQKTQSEKSASVTQKA